MKTGDRNYQNYLLYLLSREKDVHLYLEEGLREAVAHLGVWI